VPSLFARYGRQNDLVLVMGAGDVNQSLGPFAGPAASAKATPPPLAAMTAASPRPAAAASSLLGCASGCRSQTSTTWKVGRAAEWFAEPPAVDELIVLGPPGRQRQQLPLQLIGAGSNLFDAVMRGCDGLVILQPPPA